MVRRSFNRSFSSFWVLGKPSFSYSSPSLFAPYMQTHPVRNEVLCLNYLRYWPGRVLKVPLKYSMIDESPALKRGAFILAQNRFVDVTVDDGSDIPDFVEVDCTDLKLKDKVRRDRLILPEGCNWGRKVGGDFLVGSVFGRARTAGIVAEGEEGGEDN